MPEMSGEVEIAARLGEFSRLIKYGGEENTELMHFVDPDFLRMFEFQPRFGNIANVFGGGDRMAVSETAAMVYFGRTDVVGEIMTINNDTNIEISAVFADLPSNTHLNIHFLGSLEIFGEDAFTNWGSDRTHTYVKLRPGADTAPIKTAILEILTETFGQNANATVEITFQPLADIHFTPGLENEISTTDRFTGQTRIFRDYSDIQIFTGVGLFILIISCINFMNLQVAQIAIRAREIGIRKVLGASVGQIVTMLSWDLVKLVIVANVIAWPLAFIWASDWLEAFAYRSGVDWTNFAIAGLGALIVAQATISWRALRAARVSPVLLLHHE